MTCFDRTSLNVTPLRRRWLYLVPFFAVHVGGCATESNTEALPTKAELGERLFRDKDLSAQRSQACVTCHDPDRAFVDGRLQESGEILAGSLGDDGVSVADRNAPTVAYASLVPPLEWSRRERFNTDSDFAEYEGYRGGLFLDGRALELQEQATGPLLNPAEMGMPNKASIVSRLLESSGYVAAFEEHYGEGILDDDDEAFTALADAIATFERTQLFTPFDSRYDRSLLAIGNERRYQYDPASKAAQGKALFFSTEFTNCAACHQLHPQGSSAATEEAFTGFEYHNLGVPENTQLRERSGGSLDLGLGSVVDESAEDGKFRTPTLRNVAVTAPYMHNGLFQELSTVIRFYEHAKLRARGVDDDSVNPESGEPWRNPEVDRNVSNVELASGNKDLTDDGNVLALVCFLLSLTDSRYEGRLDVDQVARCGLD